jgi:hypothetical protein
MTRKMRDIMSTAPVCMAPGESVSPAASALSGVSAAPPNS